MKKLIAVMGLIGGLFFLSGRIQAGLPLDQLRTSRNVYVVPANSTNPPSAFNYPVAPTWNTSISASSAAASGASATIILPVAQATMTFTNGVNNSTFSARNCITDLTVELSNASTFYILDGNTTSYVIYGASILDFSGSTASEWTKHWDHTGPFCGTAGNTLTLSLPAPSAAVLTNAINVDGYTVLTGLAAIYNVQQ